MAQFLRHTSCPQCGSRDNLGEYSDGSAFCFGCHYYRSGSILSKIQERLSPESDNTHRPIPSDCSTHFHPIAVSWLTQYDVSLAEYIKRGVVYSPSKHQIIFRWFNNDKLVLWQARNLNKEYTDKEGRTKPLPKYFMSGDHSDICTIFTHSSNERSSRLVLVEDATSAIKTALARPLNGPTTDAMPLLGTHLPSQKINALTGYKQIYVWLDHDKGKEALKLANRLSLQGFDAKPIFTEFDPKEAPYDFIESILK